MAKFLPRSQTVETEAPAEIPETHGPELVPPIATTAKRGAGRPKGSKNRRKPRSRPRSRIGRREDKAIATVMAPADPWANAPLNAWAKVVEAMAKLPNAGMESTPELFAIAYKSLTAYGAAKYDARVRTLLLDAIGYAMLILEAEGG